MSRHPLFPSLLLFFSLLLLFSARVACESITIVEGESYTPECDKTVGCFLRDMTVVVTQNIETEKNGFDITLTNLTCTHFFLGLDTVESSLWASRGSGMNISVGNFGLRCTALWAYRLHLPPHIPKDNGPLAIEFYGSDMSFGVELTQTANGSVNGALLSFCSVFLNVSYFNMTGDRLTISTVKSEVSSVNETIQDSVTLLICTDFLSSLINTHLNNTLSRLSLSLSPLLSPLPPLSPLSPSADVVNFTNSLIVRALSKGVSVFLSSQKRVDLNSLINFLTAGTGTLPLSEFFPFPFSSNISLFGADLIFSFSIPNVLVESLNDVVEVDVLHPYEETCTYSEIQWSKVRLHLDFDMEIVLVAPPQISFPQISSQRTPYSEISRSDSVFPLTLFQRVTSMEFVFDNVTLQSSQQVFLDKTQIDHLFGGEIFMTKFECLLHLVDLFHLLSFNVVTEFSNLTFSSPNSSVIPIENLFADIVTLFVYATGSDVFDIVNHVFMADLVPAFNGKSDALLKEEHSQQCLKLSGTSAFEGYVTLLGFFVMLVIAILMLLYMTYSDWIFRKRVGTSSSEETKLMTVTGTTNYSSNDIGQYLMESQEVACGSSESGLPWIVRGGMFCFMMVVCAMMISYLSGIGASVFMDIHLTWEQEKILHFPSLFDFSFMSCLRLFEESRVYLSALLIGLGGLFDPVIILGFVIFIWIAPPSYMRSHTRISILQTCMTYAKWIIISGYLLDILSVAFKIFVSPPIFEGSYFQLFVFGRYAFFANLFAWIALCVLLLLVYYCQLNYSRKYPKEVKEKEDGKEDEESRYSPSKIKSLVFVSCSCLGFLFLLLGLFLPSIKVSFHGLVSLAVPEPRVFSLFSLGTTLPSTGGVDSAEWNLAVVTADYLLFTFVFPILHSLALLCLAGIQFYLYMNTNKDTPRSLLPHAHTIFTMAEIFNLFSCADVFTALYLLLLPQLYKFAIYIIAVHCGVINTLLRIPLLAEWLGGYSTCFALEADLLYGFYFLIFGCVFIRIAHYTSHLIFPRVRAVRVSGDKL